MQHSGGKYRQIYRHGWVSSGSDFATSSPSIVNPLRNRISIRVSVSGESKSRVASSRGANSHWLNAWEARHQSCNLPGKRNGRVPMDQEIAAALEGPRMQLRTVRGNFHRRTQGYCLEL